MTPREISALANQHVNAWRDSGLKLGRGLRAHVEDAIREAYARGYEGRCREGRPPFDINNPAYIPHCSPEHASDL